MVKSQNKESYNKIFTKLKEHHKWFENSIPLIASEIFQVQQLEKQLFLILVIDMQKVGLEKESMLDVSTLMM